MNKFEVMITNSVGKREAVEVTADRFTINDLSMLIFFPAENSYENVAAFRNWSSVKKVS